MIIKIFYFDLWIVIKLGYILLCMIIRVATLKKKMMKI
jgi:hypothetical protein